MRPAIPLIRAAPLRAFIDRLRVLGVPVEGMLERVRLSPRIALADDAESLVPLVAFRDLMEATARSQGLDALGIQAGAALELRHLGLFGCAIARGPTLGGALARAFHIWPTYDSGERGCMTRRGDQVDIHHQFLLPGVGESPQASAFSLAIHLKLIARAVGPHWYPTAIGLPTRELPGARSLPMLANARLEFGRRCMTITLPAALLDCPMPVPDGIRRDPLGADWSATAPAFDIDGAVRQVIASMLPEGYPGVHQVADAVGMSARTLQRRLQQQGVTFAGAVAKARFVEAQRLLRQPDRKIIDVALELGYSDPAHFSRAFCRWAGMTPRDFRRRLREAPPMPGGVFSPPGHVLGTRP